MSQLDATPTADSEFRCPVCRARFRNAASCSRCGTDLSPLMRVAARSWVAQERCRDALNAGDLGVALQWIERARQLQRK